MTSDERDALILPDQSDALRDVLAGVEKQIGRLGREQFKTNTLAETQAAQLTATLEALRSADERREAELASLRERLRTVQIEARLDIVRSILPALDGIDQALRSGRETLDLAKTDRSAPNDTRRANAGDLLRALLGLTASLPPPNTSQEAALLGTLDSWLVGLTFVRRRLLNTLAAEGVVPMNAEGSRFDPRYHVAAEVVAAGHLPPGTVAQEIRRGYMVGDRVLRHADVAVVAPESDQG
ncbi:MAG: nucleotide exchange factor GrpE [Roseiflexaceae bacterium]|nr:nucleotide exchange factor GrpE [Roseiflexaceae bacterium]